MASRVDPASGCLFCTPDPTAVLAENALAFAIRDGFPVTPLHSLIIPKRHAVDYFALTADEVAACDDLLRRVRARLLAEDPTIEGFNIGLNVGEVAGQTVMHCHTHLIPRRTGDVPDPRGGIRHTIPGKGYYPHPR